MLRQMEASKSMVAERQRCTSKCTGNLDAPSFVTRLHSFFSLQVKCTWSQPPSPCFQVRGNSSHEVEKKTMGNNYELKAAAFEGNRWCFLGFWEFIFSEVCNNVANDLEVTLTYLHRVCVLQTSLQSSFAVGYASHAKPFRFCWIGYGCVNFVDPTLAPLQCVLCCKGWIDCAFVPSDFSTIAGTRHFTMEGKELRSFLNGSSHCLYSRESWSKTFNHLCFIFSHTVQFALQNSLCDKCFCPSSSVVLTFSKISYDPSSFAWSYCHPKHHHELAFHVHPFCECLVARKVAVSNVSVKNCFFSNGH